MDVRSFDGAVIARNPNFLNRKNQSAETFAPSDVSFSGNAPVESNSGKFLKSAFIAGLSIAPFVAA
ncbi:MAG: hypothetical protein K2X66_12450, partial [Cyanobacteria bacterium]|nr:hypothetical protein [Cyanobacteriota bacterium]